LAGDVVAKRTPAGFGIKEWDLVLSANVSQALANNIWRIGRSTAQGVDDTPNGKIANIRIYNRELSVSEVLKIRNFEKP
jgi:hypothetical protein